MTKKLVSIVYRAFSDGDIATTKPVVIETYKYKTDEDLCEQVFVQTNTYYGEIWDALQPLPENRSHTALSVGDSVIIDGVEWTCEALGWKRRGDGHRQDVA